MNYFELFDIPMSLVVDKSSINRKYFELQKKYHPDYYGQGTEEEKEEALEKSSMVNKAFRTFNDPDATLKYVLQLRGLLEEEEKYQLPNDFLMEVMELNEMKMDGAEDESVKAKSSELMQQVFDEVKDVFDGFDESTTSEADLLRLKDYYYKKKYLDRLLAE